MRDVLHTYANFIWNKNSIIVPQVHNKEIYTNVSLGFSSLTTAAAFSFQSPITFIDEQR